MARCSIDSYQLAGLTISGPVRGHLDYDPNNVFFIVDPSTLNLPPGLTENQQAVGNAINSFVLNGGALPPPFWILLELNGSNLAAALTQLSGEVATGAQQGAVQLMNQFLTLLVDPYAGGGAGLGSLFQGGAINFAPEREMFSEDLALAYAKVTKTPIYKPYPVAYQPRWTVWGSAYGGFSRTSGDPGGVGSQTLNGRAGGVAGGADYRISPDTVIGVALAGAGTSWGLAPGIGTGRSDAVQLGTYGITRSGPIYLAASAAFTNYWMSTDRFALGDHLTASFDARSFGARVEGGYRLLAPFGAVTPYGALQAQGFSTPGYAETGLVGGGFALAYAARTATATRSELGAKFDRQIAIDANAALGLRGSLAWAHDEVSDPTVAATFQALPGASFSVRGATPAKDLALVSAGAELRLRNGVTVIGSVQSEHASGVHTYTGSGTVRVNW